MAAEWLILAQFQRAFSTGGRILNRARSVSCKRTLTFFERLAGQLAGLQGALILSFNDHSLVRKCSVGFSISRVPITHTAANPRGPVERAHDLVISGRKQK